MDKNYLLKWTRITGLKALKAAAQTAVALIGSSVLMSEVNWIAVLSTSALAGIISILISISEFPLDKTNSE